MKENQNLFFKQAGKKSGKSWRQWHGSPKPKKQTVTAQCPVYSEYSIWPHPAVLTEEVWPSFFFIRVISNFLENSWRYSKVKVHHRYQRTPVANLPTVPTTPATNLPLVLIRQWQIRTISNCLHLKVKLEGKNVSIC